MNKPKICIAYRDNDPGFSSGWVEEPIEFTCFSLGMTYLVERDWPKEVHLQVKDQQGNVGFSMRMTGLKDLEIGSPIWDIVAERGQAVYREALRDWQRAKEEEE